MFRIGFILLTVISVHTLARTMTEPPDLRTFPIPVGTTDGHEMDTSVSTTEKSIIAEAVTAIAESPRSNNSSWWSNIFSGVVPAYRKVTSYTGPYLLPSLLVTSIIGVVGTLVCSYTSICDAALSALKSNTKEIRSSLVYALLPYISPDNLDCLSSTVQKAVDKLSNAQKDKKID